MRSFIIYALHILKRAVRKKRPSFERFCTFTVMRPRDPVSCSRLLYSLSSFYLSLSARQPQAQVISTDDDGRDLDGSAHLLSRPLVSQ
jgi:hypothetical protein